MPDDILRGNAGTSFVYLMEIKGDLLFNTQHFQGFAKKE